MGMPRSIAVALAAVLSLAAHTAARSSAAGDTAWVIVFDDLHAPFAQTGRLRDLLRKVAAELIQEGDRYQFRASGPSAASLTTDALTDDRSLASSTIKFMIGNGLKDRDTLAAGAGKYEVLYRANIALDAAEEAVFALTREAAPHQAIVYVSSGYDVDTFPAIAERVRAVARRARENNITIFAIDARGFNLADLDPSIDTSTTATRRSLTMISEETGGFVIENPREPGTPLARINAQMRN
jgi:hypothetical protein